jgi:hypothetical protein
MHVGAPPAPNISWPVTCQRLSPTLSNFSLNTYLYRPLSLAISLLPQMFTLGAIGRNIVLIAEEFRAGLGCKLC